MNYQETLGYLYSQLPMYQRVGPAAFKKDLTNTIALCKAFNDPQDKFRSIHIAGTNGKGSVAHMLASALQEAGYKTGLYTSPHYVDFRERIKVDGDWISEKTVIDFVDRYIGFKDDLLPSFFELTVVMAFDNFAKQNVDIAVVETGLGGRLDSTNIIQPLLSVITNISLDHQTFLGNDIPTIAQEKAGIIKEGVPVVIGEFNEDSFPVFKKSSRERRSPLISSWEYYSYDLKRKDLYSSTADVSADDEVIYQDLKIPFPVEYQWLNVLTSLSSIDILNDSGFDVSRKNFSDGLQKIEENTSYIFRSKFINSNPIIGWDSAHNITGLQVLMKEISSIEHTELHVVFSSVKEKEEILQEYFKVFPQDTKFYFCQADIPRALEAEKIQKIGFEVGIRGKVIPRVSEAFDQALRSVSKDGLVLVCGSIFTVGELMKEERLGSFPFPPAKDPADRT